MSAHAEWCRSGWKLTPGPCNCAPTEWDHYMRGFWRGLHVWLPVGMLAGAALAWACWHFAGLP